MAKVNELDQSVLIQAVLIWTGYGNDIMPRRDDSVLHKRYGEKLAAKLLSIIKSLEHDFCLSDARLIAKDLIEMEKISSEQFKQNHPEIDDKIIEAFAWCYTFDNK